MATTDIAVPSSQALVDPKQRLQKIVEEYTTAARKALEIRLAATDLEPLDFASMKMTVTDDSSAAIAAECARACEEYKEKVAQIFEPPATFFFKVHRWLTGTRGELTRPADEVIAHNKQQTAAYLRRREQERRELEAKLQREAEERARAERERIQREREEKAAEAMPWDLVDQEPAKPVVVTPAPRVVIPSMPAPAGIKEKRKPWTYEVEDLHALVKAAAADPSLLDALQPNDRYLKLKAKEMGESLGKRFPGVRAVRDTRVEF